jgi:hypothetical protein
MMKNSFSEEAGLAKTDLQKSRDISEGTELIVKQHRFTMFFPFSKLLTVSINSMLSRCHYAAVRYFSTGR